MLDILVRIQVQVLPREPRSQLSTVNIFSWSKTGYILSSTFWIKYQLQESFLISYWFNWLRFPEQCFDFQCQYHVTFCMQSWWISFVWVLDVQDSFLSPSVAALMAASVAASLAAKVQIHQFCGAMINDPKYNISHLFTDNFSAVYIDPGFQNMIRLYMISLSWFNHNHMILTQPCVWCGKWKIAARLWKRTSKHFCNKWEVELAQCKRCSFQLFSTRRTLSTWKRAIWGLATELVVNAVANVVADKIYFVNKCSLKPTFFHINRPGRR